MEFGIGLKINLLSDDFCVILLEKMETDKRLSQEASGRLVLSFSSESVQALVHLKNEDAIAFSQEGGFAMVFDGVGGHKGGHLASKAACQFIPERIPAIRSLEPEKARHAMESLFRLASKKVREEIEGGTTATAAVFLDDGRTAVICHVGDSRAYIFRGGRLTRLTQDDGIVYKELPIDEAERIMNRLDSVCDLFEMDAEELYYFKRKHELTQALGLSKTINPQSYKQDLTAGDILFLATDGVFDNLTTGEMQEVLGSKGENLAGAIVAMAYKRSEDRRHLRAKPDDISAIVVHVA